MAVLVLTNLLSLGCLIWVLRDARLSELASDLARFNWWWIAVAAFAEVSVYLVQAMRWGLILAPVVSMPVRQTARAIYVGMFASETLPARAGEVLRCYLVSRWTGLPFSVSMSSVVIERIFDAVLMWAGLKLTVDVVDLPGQFRFAIDSVGFVALIAVIALALMLLLPRPAARPLVTSGWRYRLWVFRDDLAQIGHSWYLPVAFLMGLPYLALQVVPVWVLFSAYGFDLPLRAAIALMLILRVASAIPGAPANIGVFQFAAKEFLERGFGIPPDQAASYSLLLWAVVKLPILAAGAVALSITGAKLGELTQAARTESAGKRA